MPRYSLLLVLCASPAFAAAPPAAPAVSFEKDVRPLLARACFSCHGPEKQRAGLRLDD